MDTAKLCATVQKTLNCISVSVRTEYHETMLGVSGKLTFEI